MDSTLLPSNVSSNITYNEDILTETLQEIKKSSFEYVKQIQKDLVGYLRFDFTFNQFNPEIDRLKAKIDRYELDIPKQFIPTEKKKVYLNSGVFRQEVNISDIASKYDVFTYNFLVFIKGKVYTNMYVLPDGDFTHLVLYVGESITQNEFNDFKKNNEKVTVLFIPNSAYGYIDTNTYALNKWDNRIDMKRVNYISTDSVKQKHFILCEDSVTKSGYFYSEAIIEDETNSLIIPPNIKKDLTSTVLKVHIISFKDFDSIIEARKDEYFQIPLKEHFIAVDNIIPFRIIDGKMHFVHSHKISYSYPDVYKLENVEDDVTYSLLAFYHKPSNDVPFANEIQLYYRFFKDKLVEMYTNDTIPEIVKTYVPKVFDFSIKDLEKSAYKDEPINYKCDKMNNFITLESRKLTNYVLNMTKKKTRLFVKTDPETLVSKVRKDTSKELIDQPDETFNEDRYVFVFYKYLLDGYSLSFFIDGSFYVPDKVFSNKKYYYYYIPKSLIKDNDVIEIEKFKTFYTEKNIVFNESKMEELNLPVDFICPRDIYIINKDTTNYYNEVNFSYVTENNEEIDCKSHKPLGKHFKVKLLNDDIKGNKFNFCFKQEHEIFELKIKDNSFITKGVGFKQDISRDSGKLRVYRNGRLVPRHKYFVQFKDSTRDIVLMNISMEKLVGDTFHFEITPDSYETNTYLKEISTSGMLDLGGYINKPFDLKWFDVFLNGYKLQPSKFDVLTPTKVLINDVKTKDNLEIIERNWFDDIFKFNTSDIPIPEDFDFPLCTDDELLDKIPELQEKVDEITKEIVVDDTIDNVLTDDITIDIVIKIVQDIFKYLINPDEILFPDIQYTKSDIPESLSKYISDNNNMVFINPSDSCKGVYTIMVDPNGTKLDESMFVENDYVIF